jgi:sulfate transport system substrate-binding protein
MLRKLLVAAGGLYVLGATAWVVSAGFVRDTGQVELLNVACDPTRELWAEINPLFVADYHAKTGRAITVVQSHGGSATQAGAVIKGMQADVVTLALWSDTDAIRKAGLMDAGWVDELDNRSLPFVSTIVFVVRKGNPKGVRDWEDLARPGVEVVTPNPKTSGNGKWSFLAIWGSVAADGKIDEQSARDLVTRVYRNTRGLDASARVATARFAQKRIGDVHLTWENEAYLEVAEANGELEIVYPPRSVLAEPHVAVVDAVVREKGTREAAEAYLKFLYTEAAQEVIARHHYRPTNEKVKARTKARFGDLDLFPVSLVDPDWDAIQRRFFAEGAVFDQALEAGGK